MYISYISIRIDPLPLLLIHPTEPCVPADVEERDPCDSKVQRDQRERDAVDAPPKGPIDEERRPEHLPRTLDTLLEGTPL